VSLATLKYSRLFSDLLVLLKVFYFISIFYFFNAIIFFFNLPATIRITLSPFTKIATILITSVSKNYSNYSNYSSNYSYSKSRVWVVDFGIRVE